LEEAGIRVITNPAEVGSTVADIVTQS